MRKPKFPGQLISKVNAQKHKFTATSNPSNLTTEQLFQRNFRQQQQASRPTPKVKNTFNATLGLDTQGYKHTTGTPVPASGRLQVMHNKRKKKHKTVSVTYKPGDYKESEEIKAIRALDEMHKGIKAKKHHKKKKNFIAKAIKHPGALHRQLGIKQGHKIPAKTLARAAAKGGTLGRRARLAQTLKGFH